jgi:hypothetical protein
VTGARRWPLFLIAAPAAVAIWSGWVGLGELCGFGVIHPLPGIVPGLQLNTAITLPVGVEAYAASRWARGCRRRRRRVRGGSPAGPRSAHSPTAWPGRSSITCSPPRMPAPRRGRWWS